MRENDLIIIENFLENKEEKLDVKEECTNEYYKRRISNYV